MEIITIKTNENEEPIVSGRELYEKLEIKTPYTQWMDRMLDYGFIENIDFVLHSQKSESSNITGFKVVKDHFMKLDMAKEIAMLQRNEKGQEIRKYFIQVEKDFNSPEKIMARALKIANKQIESLGQVNQKLIGEIKENAPRVEFSKTIENSSSCILIREFSKILANEGISLGEKKLYKQLRNWGYILNNSTEPTQRAVEQGLFMIDERIIKTVKGDLITRTTKITGKGQVFLLSKIKNEYQD